jgi:hypothetical protein
MIDIYHREGDTSMARPKGSTNKTPRELEAEAKRLMEQAKLKKRIAKLQSKK